MDFPTPLTLREISDLMNTRFKGNPDHLVTGINEIHMVKHGDLTFVDHPKYYQKALQSKATTILINKELDVPDGKALIISDDPFRDFVFLLGKYKPFIPATSYISPTAKIGNDTVIQPGVFIGDGVKIGNGCVIHANVSIYDRCIIGDRVIIHSNSVIGADAYYFQRKENRLRKMESCGRVLIKNDVEIGALCSIDRGVTSDTIISEGTKFDNHVQVGHDTYIGKHCLIGAHAAIAGVTRIEDEVVLWGRVAVDKDLVIGKGAVILATSAVDKSLEGGKTYFGVPADDFRKKWRELASLRKLPEIIERL